MANGLTGLC